MLVRYSGSAPTQLGFISPLQLPGATPSAAGAIAIFNMGDGRCVDLYADPTRTTSLLGPDGSFAVAFSVLSPPTLAPRSIQPPPQASFKSGVTVYRGQLKTLPPIDDQISSGLVSTDGQHIVAVSRSLPSGSYATLDLTVPNPAWPSGPLESGLPIAVSRSGKYLAVMNGSLITLRSGDKEWTFEATGASFPFGTSAVATFDRAESHLVVAGGGGQMRVWKLDQLDKRPANDSWDSLMTYFADATQACLDETERHNLLGEDWLDAGSRAQECRRLQKLQTNPVSNLDTRGITPWDDTTECADLCVEDACDH